MADWGVGTVHAAPCFYEHYKLHGKPCLNTGPCGNTPDTMPPASCLHNMHKIKLPT